MKKPCSQPGCPLLIDNGRFCAAHAGNEISQRQRYDKHRKNDPVLSLAARIRSSARWQAVRKLKRSINPLCEDPFGTHAIKGATESAQQIHHIEPIATHPALAFDLGNLMSVCTHCHALLESQAAKSPNTPGMGSKV